MCAYPLLAAVSLRYLPLASTQVEYSFIAMRILINTYYMFYYIRINKHTFTRTYFYFSIATLLVTYRFTPMAYIRQIPITYVIYYYTKHNTYWPANYFPFGISAHLFRFVCSCECSSMCLCTLLYTTAFLGLFLLVAMGKHISVICVILLLL